MSETSDPRPSDPRPSDPGPYDPEREGARTDFRDRMAYGDYLRLDLILGAQVPLTDAHDEMLFVIQHQTSELWMRLAIHEIGAARDLVASGDLAPAMKMLARVSRILEQLNNAWDVLRTMTPSDYTRFREQLGESSGFQSRQYRLLEYMLGNRNLAMMKPHAHDAPVTALLLAEIGRPSLYDEAIRAAHRMGAPMPAAILARDVRDTHRFDEGVMEAWRGSTSTPTAIGGSTSWPRSWWTWRTTSAGGDSTTSPPSSG
jgi:tryptophan 2,3-dioxygenase